MCSHLFVSFRWNVYVCALRDGEEKKEKKKRQRATWMMLVRASPTLFRFFFYTHTRTSSPSFNSCIHRIYIQCILYMLVYGISHPYSDMSFHSHKMCKHPSSTCGFRDEKDTKEKCQCFILLTKLFIWAHLVETKHTHKFYVTFVYRGKKKSGAIYTGWRSLIKLEKNSWYFCQTHSFPCFTLYVCVCVSICVWEAKGVEKFFFRMAANSFA